MRETLPKWLRLLPVTLAVLLFAEAAGVGLMLVHLRHTCALSADAITELRRNLRETGQHMQEAGAQIAYAQQPDVLRERVGTRLAPMQSRQIVWVGPPAQRPPDFTPLPTLSPRVAVLEPAANLAHFQ